MLDFKTKSRPCQTIAVKSEKNSRFLAINHTLVSFEKETYKGNKKIPTRFTLIRPVSAGWASAPYRQNHKTPRASKLSELCGGQDPCIKFYSFEKVSNNMEKGPRCDDISFELRAGDALNFWLDDKRLDEVKRTMDSELTKIEPFTICEVFIAPKNNESIAKGYACKITIVKPCDFTLYSCIPDLDRMPSTLVDARSALLKHQQTQPHLANDLITNEPSFFINVIHKAYIHEDVESPDFVTLVNSGIEPIDIPVATLLRYTNSTKKEQACSLLEMAIANSALQMFVIYNDFWKNATNSAFRGIPIINTEMLLQSVVPARIGEQTCFHTPNTTTVEDITYSIAIHVETEPVAVANGIPPRTPDFVLSCLQVELERAYKVRFALSSPEGEEIPRYWVGYFDASPRKTAPAVGFHKRKYTPCMDAEDDAT